jgi:hypothetical protein
MFRQVVAYCSSARYTYGGTLMPPSEEWAGEGEHQPIESGEG